MARKNKTEAGSFRFTFNGNLIAELGEESISNPNIAIAELLKNAYDADSTQVLLQFQNIEKHNTTLRLVDDGVGMSLTDIKDRFMDVGSPHKKGIDRTPELDRVPVGAKGIGRFASHSLASLLVLDSAVKGEKTGHELEFDWTRFSPKIKATDVDIPMKEYSKMASERGTTLELRNLKENWNDIGRLKPLLKDIELLISPIDPPKRFKVKHNIPTEDIDLSKIKSKFFELAAYSFKARLIKRKELQFDFFKLGKRIKSGKETLSTNLSCGDAEFELNFYYKVAHVWKENTGKNIKREDLDYVKSVLKEYGGIKLYRDHFRVKPYGDEGADWIGLDTWSRNFSDVPGNPQVLGFVSITKDGNPDIEDTTTREGVINNTAFYDLVKFVTTAVDQFVLLKNGQEKGRVKARRLKRPSKTIKVQKPKALESSQSTKHPLLIEIRGSYPSIHYGQIVFEANECNERNYPNAAFWLCRKIVENLVTHILKKKYPSRPELWYDAAKSRVLNLSQLIENLHTHRQNFSSPEIKHQIESFNADVGSMRKAVNATVHNYFDYLTDRDDLKKYKINKIIQTLVDIYSAT
jgi:hypothetical protein